MSKKITGVITTQNLVPAGVATAGSAVELSTRDAGTVGVQTKGTYTGALSAQITVDGVNWITLGASDTFTRKTTGVQSATITSGEQDVYAVSVAAAETFRITGLAAMTGSVTVTLHDSPVGEGGGDGGSDGGGGEALDPVILGAGPTAITHDDHSNRAVYSEQALTTSVVFAVAATSGAEDGDLVTILNLGAGPMVASGANVVLAPGNRAYARENERFVFEYFADDDIYYGGCPDVFKAGRTASFSLTPINASTTVSATGCAQMTARDSSGITAHTIAATNAFTHLQQVTWVSAAAVNRVAGATLALPIVWPTAAIPYGWQIRGVFGPNDALTACQMFCAVTATTLAAGTEPSAKVNVFGLAADSTDTNLSIIHNNAAGSVIPIALGASFPANGAAANMYEVITAAWADGTAVHAYYQVTHLISRATVFGTVTGAELPVDGTVMIYDWVRGTEANVTSATICFGGIFGGYWS